MKIVDKKLGFDPERCADAPDMRWFPGGVEEEFPTDMNIYFSPGERDGLNLAVTAHDLFAIGDDGGTIQSRLAVRTSRMLFERDQPSGLVLDMGFPADRLVIDAGVGGQYKADD